MATDGDWHYSIGGVQQGPVPLADLRELLREGKISATDLVWRVGMPRWQPAGQTPQLRLATPAASPPAAPVDYFTPGAGMPQRARAALMGHARPTGDTQTWPLDEALLAQFNTTLKIRKRVMSAVQLFRLLGALSAISAAIFIPLSLLSLSGVSTTRGLDVGALISVAVTSAALAALYFLAARATKRSRRWAPLTMLILFCCCLGLQLISLSITAWQSANSAAAASVLTVGVFSFAIQAAFALISWRALEAIPRYLNQPAWCQELVVTAGL
jgi:hypothetical protein